MTGCSQPTLQTACQTEQRCPQATLKLGQQLREQQFRLHSPNPRMLPREFMPERLDVDCSMKTPQKADEPLAAEKGGSKRGRGGERRVADLMSVVLATVTWLA